jgi:hypothetical protein
VNQTITALPTTAATTATGIRAVVDPGKVSGVSSASQIAVMTPSSTPTSVPPTR